MVNQVLELYGTVYVVEDIIHNRIFMKELEKKGIIKVDSVEEIPDGSTVMFSAHGISPQVVDIAEKKELNIIDGTCPIVKSIQDEVKKEANSKRKIIIIGNRGHAEVISLLGYAENTNAFVVYNEMDIDLLPDFKNDEVVYFTQTTLDYLYVDLILGKLKEKIPQIRSSSHDNVCYATKERQDAIRRIASSVDLVIVIGSSYSSNAKRLCEVALDSGVKKVVLIDSIENLKETDLKKITAIAITSAASTPDKLIQELVEFLRERFDLIIKNLENQDDSGE
jgi:4-hydroxy-3-methylbut-2-enyl diphosphate reductase